MEVALLHVLRQGRLVRQGGDVPVLHVDLAGEHVEEERFDVLIDREGDAIEIGQLGALAVDLPEIGIALDDNARGAADIGLDDDPRVENRLVRVAPARRDLDVAVLGAEEIGPAGHAGRLDHVVQLVVVLGQELTGVVLAEQRRMLAERRGELLEEQAVGAGELELDGVVVDLGDRRSLTLDRKDAGDDAVEIGILDAVLDREHDIVGGEGLAVRPFHALAQMEDEGRAVLADVPALGDVRNCLGEVEVPAGQAHIADATQDAVVVVAAGEAATPGAAIGAELVAGLDHFRADRKAVGELGQLAARDHVGEFGRFLRTGRAGIAWHQRESGGAGHALQHASAEQPRPTGRGFRVVSHHIPPMAVACSRTHPESPNSHFEAMIGEVGQAYKF